MKKWAMFLCFLMLVCIVPTSALAGGEFVEFCINGFDYGFYFGQFYDEDLVADNSSLEIRSYNDSNLLDINNVSVPQGLYLYEIMQATELPSNFWNWELHKNEYIPVDERMTRMYFFLIQMKQWIFAPQKTERRQRRFLFLTGNRLLPVTEHSCQYEP